ncbi:MAG: YggS family pyridoxal phosphate-dependent enzyme [Epsilonproteobacteria bacterium]|nr:YggS family pyridoxal phosphate-dependent enzyme [Campylobacterota bacterium]
MDRFEENFDKVWQKVEKARIETNEHSIVKIVAVSKYVGKEEIKALYDIGQRAFGENRVQDLKDKSSALEDLPLEWHFIGRLQKNKINHLIDLPVSLIQSCNGFELAKEIDKRAAVKGKKLDILLQINSSGEPTKAGVSPQSAIDTYEQIANECKNLTLKGVMSIGAHTDNEKEIIKSFETTYKIYEKLKPKGAQICSMGMSGDFELAIKCGSNMLRLGSILFNSH